MRTIETYISLAVNKNKLRSNNELARVIGIKGPSLCYLTQKKSVPSDETILKIAELAGIPAEEALVDVSIWRNENNPKVQNVWKSIAKKTVTFSILSIICIGNIIPLVSDNIYIMYT